MKVTFPVFSLIIVLGLAVLVVGRYFYFKPRFIQGERAPDFTATLRNGEQFNLSDLKGNYVLLDFWGSWCGPCRAQSPQLVQLYSRYKNKKFKDGAGFELISVGVEQDASRWERAIQQDGLLWPLHILDKSTSLRFFNGKVAALYKVRQVPTSFLINPKGYIMGVNQSPEELDRVLSER